jgi:hypothetical protein
MASLPARQLKLGAILEDVGADHATWRDPDLPGDASINIDWYIENARAARQQSSILCSSSIRTSSPRTPHRIF